LSKRSHLLDLPVQQLAPKINSLANGREACWRRPGSTEGIYRYLLVVGGGHMLTLLVKCELAPQVSCNQSKMLTRGI